VIEGVDYSDARPSPTGLANVGKIFAGRYVGAGSGPKMLLRAEAEELSAAGLYIVSLVEGAEADALQGRNKGIEHAQLFEQWHREQGFSWPAVGYFAVDFDVQASQWPAVLAYFQGVQSVIGVRWTGMYGGLHAIEWAQRDGVARWFMQTSAWSGGVWAPNVHIEQYHNDVFIVGGAVDLDRAPTNEYGGWNMTASPVDPLQAQVDDNGWALNALTHLHELTQGGRWKGVPVEIVPLLKTMAAQVAAIEVGLQSPVAPTASPTVDLAPVLTGLTALSNQLADMEQAATVDAVAIGRAMTADPAFAAALASAVAAQLAQVQLGVTLSGSAVGGILPPKS
jgi:hypothetical protein